MIKVSTDKETGEPDGKWPPSMRAKVPFRVDKETGLGTYDCKVYDSKEVDKNNNMKQFKINGENPEHDLADIFVKGARVRCLLQCVGLWIASGNYMCQWKVTKAEVEVPEGYGNDNFLPESEDEGEEVPVSNVKTNNFIEDSEEEPAEAEPEVEAEVEEVEAEPEPEPVKKPAKKVRKKVVKK